MRMKKLLYALIIACALALTGFLITDTTYLFSAFRIVWLQGNTDVL
jgi:hypothetical protein